MARLRTDVASEFRVSDGLGAGVRHVVEGCLFALLIGVGMAEVGGCSGGGPSQTKPVASLAGSVRAGSAFERIREEWAHSTEADRHVLRHDLEAFLAEFPRDGLAPLARVYSALTWMSPPQDWGRAEAILAAMAEPPPGTAHDLFLVARAKDLRRHHDADAAFDLLRPLVGKMVDATARGLLDEEVSLDALEAHRDYEAIAYMDAWIRGANEEARDEVLMRVAKVLMLLPEESLVGSLRAMRAEGSSKGYGVEIRRLVTERIGRIAVERNDPPLARWLLDPDAGSAPVVGSVGVELGELATSKRGLGNVAGRTVGLVLPTSSNDLRGKAADVVRGVAWALELPRDHPEGGDQVRLVTHDDSGEPDELVASLEEMAGEGASIIVTGLDVASADRALAWAETKPIAVIVLSAPSAPPSGSFGFVLGQDLAPVLEELVGAMATERGKDAPPVASVVDGDSRKVLVERFSFDGGAPWRVPVACDVPPTKVGEPRFPVASWRASGIHAWLLATSPQCADDVIHEVVASREEGIFALALEAAGVTERPRPGVRLLAASAGIVPSSTARSGDPREIDAGKMMNRSGRSPTWWSALGRDAGVLSRTALATMPLDTVTSPDEISRRRRAARDALATARASLWTTDARGFGAAAGSGGDRPPQVIERAIRIVDLALTRQALPSARPESGENVTR